MGFIFCRCLCCPHRTPGVAFQSGTWTRMLLISSLSCLFLTNKAEQSEAFTLNLEFLQCFSAKVIFAKQASFYFCALPLLLNTEYRNQGEKREMSLHCLKELDWYEAKHFPLNSQSGASISKSTLVFMKTSNYSFIEARAEVWQITKVRKMQMLH